MTLKVTDRCARIVAANVLSTENIHTPRVRLDDLFKFLQQLISQRSSPAGRTIKTGTGRIAAYRSRIIVAADNVAACQSTAISYVVERYRYVISKPGQSSGMTGFKVSTFP